MNEYKLLDKTLNEDLDKVREFAEAMTERTVLDQRVKYINSLLDESIELRSSVWTTIDGQSKAISDLDDSHLKNIVKYLTDRGVYNRRIALEAEKRFDTIRLIENNEDF